MTDSKRSPHFIESEQAIALPDFSAEGYEVRQELGHNRAGGRITYLAREFNGDRTVVIKQFQFAGGNRWEEYDACQREIDILKTLDHPQIPRYLDSFQTPDGFCMVQEYKNAPSLAEPQVWNPQQVRHVAIAILDILQYLQERIPPVIHRDLKPDNILVDDQLNVYVVDFGFARLGGGQVAVSSVVKGTLGFMPPEQLFNRELTPASDLYSLGMTLICMLTQVPATEVGMLMDEAGQVHIRDRLSHLSLEFLTWLETLSQPQVHHRYSNAAEAQRRLKQISHLTQTFRLPAKTVLAWGGLSLIAITAGAIALQSTSRLSPNQLGQELWRTIIPLSADKSFDAAIETLNPTAALIESGQFTPAWTVTFARQLDPSTGSVDLAATLPTIPTEGEWVTVIEAQNLPNGSYHATCDLLNSAGDPLDGFTREALVLAENQQLRLWCRYRIPDPSDESTVESTVSAADSGDRPQQVRLRLDNPDFDFEVIHPPT
ncbi:MAG: serine/threonine-protein kinase [Elainellaceae cyanobacterium]